MIEEKELNRYSRLLEAIFTRHYQEGQEEIVFERAELSEIAIELEMRLPKNLGDILYSFRYRTALPLQISAKAPEGYEWIIRPAGKGRYKFVLTQQATIIPSNLLVETKIPDATPGIITRYSMNDEQSLLAKLRYNRLVDVFTGLTCYSLQNHLRTTLRDGSQIETDEIYVGIDKRGVHYVLPIQAKGGRDRIGVVQIEQDFAMCSTKFPGLICRSIATQFMDTDFIALFEFEMTGEGVRIAAERHYRLVQSEDLSATELETYLTRLG